MRHLRHELVGYNTAEFAHKDLNIAGLKELEDDEGIIEGSVAFHIWPNGVGAPKLKRVHFQEKQARRMFRWMKRHLPHGIYQKLKVKVIENNINAKN